MGSLSIRRFFISDQDEIFRVPNTRFQKLYDGALNIDIDWCVGKRIRHSEIVVELKNKKPVSVFRTNYSYIHFDSNGFLDRDRFMRDGMVVVQASDVFNCFKQPAEGNLIDANQKFAQRKLHGSIWWKPDSQLERNIFDAAVDDIRCRRI